MIENEKIEELFLELTDKLDGALNALSNQYSQIRAGRANPHVLDSLKVEAYGGDRKSVV